MGRNLQKSLAQNYLDPQWKYELLGKVKEEMEGKKTTRKYLISLTLGYLTSIYVLLLVSTLSKSSSLMLYAQSLPKREHLKGKLVASSISKSRITKRLMIPGEALVDQVNDHHAPNPVMKRKG